MIIVGGHFNVALNVGHSNNSFVNFYNNLELSMANPDGLDWSDNQWTFKSWNGSLRRIAFI